MAKVIVLSNRTVLLKVPSQTITDFSFMKSYSVMNILCLISGSTLEFTCVNFDELLREKEKFYLELTT